jgi:HlyD family secretion protein
LVIHREVEPGQTVAASFAAPVLFIIAEDLSKMQVLADIDEADVGKVEEGMAAKVTVDAFMGDVFEGRVTQIRFSPTEVQGVVTYSAVVDVDNPALKLRPGMTATVAIVTSEEKQVLAAPNAALRFKPDEKEREHGTLQYGQARVYVVAGGDVGQEELDSMVVDVGITDGVYSKVHGDELDVGVELVTEQTDKQKKKRGFMGLF